MESHSGNEDRQYLLGVTRQLLEGVFKHYDPQTDLFVFPENPNAGYPRPGNRMRGHQDLVAESFVRPFMLAAPLLANEPGAYVLGLPVRLVFIRQLLVLTDPDSPHYLDPRKALSEPSQLTVEAALLGLCLLETQVLWWCSAPQRAQVVRWFCVLSNAPVLDNNWLWFRIFINVFLYHATDLFPVVPTLYADLSKVLSLHDQDGWYRDGTRFDQYSAWSMQFWPVYLLKWGSSLIGRDLVEFFKTGHESFCASYSHFFSREGRSMPWGRSQIYRFAAATPFAVAFNIPNHQFSPGFARHIVVNNVKRFMEHPGVVNDHGLLSIGFYDEDLFLFTVDPYSCVASPMWAAKALWCLTLPPSSPFWSAETSTGFWEELDDSEDVVVQVHPQMKITHKAGECVLDFDQHVVHGGLIDKRYIGPFRTSINP